MKRCRKSLYNQSDVFLKETNKNNHRLNSSSVILMIYNRNSVAQYVTLPGSVMQVVKDKCIFTKMSEEVYVFIAT